MRVHLEAGEGVLVHSLVHPIECTPVHSLLSALVHSQVHSLESVSAQSSAINKECRKECTKGACGCTEGACT